jgi:hypothetical protein
MEVFLSDPDSFLTEERAIFYKILHDLIISLQVVAMIIDKAYLTTIAVALSLMDCSTNLYLEIEPTVTVGTNQS